MLLSWHSQSLLVFRTPRNYSDKASPYLCSEHHVITVTKPIFSAVIYVLFTKFCLEPAFVFYIITRYVILERQLLASTTYPVAVCKSY